MKLPGAMGEMIGEALSSRLYSPAKKKWVWRLDPIGPPSDNADCPRVSFVRSLPLAAFVDVKPDSAASVAEGRHSSISSPWNWLPPLLVTIFTALPVLPPYSAENPFSRTVISCTAVRGMVLKIVWRPQPSFPVLPSTSNQV